VLAKLSWELLNHWFEGRPLALLIVGAILILVYRESPKLFKMWWAWKTNQKKIQADLELAELEAKNHSRLQIDTLVDGNKVQTQEMIKIRKSMYAHHDDKTIHFDKTGVMTDKECHNAHIKMKKYVDANIDEKVSKVHERIDKISGDFREFKGEVSALKTGT